MNGIEYVIGDALEHSGRRYYNKVIAHVMNVERMWGSGFAAAVDKKWAQPRAIYEFGSRGDLKLGDIQPVYVDDQLFVVNLIAQDLGEAPRIKYNEFQECLMKLEKFMFALGGDTELHIPRMGAGLAGGDWDIISELIEFEIHGPIYVYDLEK